MQVVEFDGLNHFFQTAIRGSSLGEEESSVYHPCGRDLLDNGSRKGRRGRVHSGGSMRQTTSAKARFIAGSASPGNIRGSGTSGFSRAWLPCAAALPIGGTTLSRLAVCV